MAFGMKDVLNSAKTMQEEAVFYKAGSTIIVKYLPNS